MNKKLHLTENENKVFVAVINKVKVKHCTNDIDDTLSIYYDDILYCNDELKSLSENSIRGIISSLKRKKFINTYITHDEDDANTISINTKKLHNYILSL